MPKKRNVVVLGSTGVLGKLALDCLEKLSDYFNIYALTGHQNRDELAKQAAKFHPKVCVLAEDDGHQPLIDVCQMPGVDVIINVLSGISGVELTRAAIQQQKTLLMGNKESLVLLGKQCLQTGLIPLDSEHHAMHEILKANPNRAYSRLFLPTSGGPLWGLSESELHHGALIRF